MPNFRLSKREAEMIASVVLGLTKEKVAASRLAALDGRSRRIEEGRKLVSQHNCRACHVVNGAGRAIAMTIQDPGMYPPDLTPQGNRVQSDWLFNFLKDPGAQKLRPWLSVRMPTFHFSDEESTTIADHFAAEAGVSLFETNARVEPDPRSVAVGGIVFRMLRCAQCHPSGGAIAPTVDLASLAPDLQLSRARLRHDWIPDWVRRPNEIIPGTRMPTNFPRDPESGEFTSPLPLAIDSPANATLREELTRFFVSEEEMRETLADAEKVTEYLRDYIWSIGSPQMYEAGPTREPYRAPLPAMATPDQMAPAQETRTDAAVEAVVPAGGR
jgi:mono/diheme cytochrome c family protein